MVKNAKETAETAQMILSSKYSGGLQRGSELLTLSHQRHRPEKRFMAERGSDSRPTPLRRVFHGSWQDDRRTEDKEGGWRAVRLFYPGTAFAGGCPDHAPWDPTWLHEHPTRSLSAAGTNHRRRSKRAIERGAERIWHSHGQLCSRGHRFFTAKDDGSQALYTGHVSQRIALRKN